MAVTSEELESFTRFASEKLNNGGADSVLELAKDWTARKQAEDLASIQRGVADADAGRMESLDEVDSQLRTKFDIPAA
jgi:hypothetical protein